MTGRCRFSRQRRRSRRRGCGFRLVVGTVGRVVRGGVGIGVGMSLGVGAGPGAEAEGRSAAAAAAGGQEEVE